MYLDPGSANLIVQSLFAILAVVLAAFRTSRLWIAALWSRAVGWLAKIFRRRTPRDDAP